MAKKISKAKAKTAVSGVLKSVFGSKPSKKCSTSGSKLATDKSKATTRSKAGSTLGSNTCKAPARRRSFSK